MATHRAQYALSLVAAREEYVERREESKTIRILEEIALQTKISRWQLVCPLQQCLKMLQMRVQLWALPPAKAYRVVHLWLVPHERRQVAAILPLRVA
jgi:hypothetical protein